MQHMHTYGMHTAGTPWQCVGLTLPPALVSQEGTFVAVKLFWVACTSKVMMIVKNGASAPANASGTQRLQLFGS
jgi:hypothetical protein